MSKISIIVPIYKVEKYLARCVDSILAQTFKDYELILVDDGSPDNCPKMCDEYAAKYDFIHVIHKQNGGLSSARNVGIDWAMNNSDSKYLLFVDSDDRIKRNLLKKTVKLAQKHNADIVCFGIEMVDENLNIIKWGTMHMKKNALFEKKNRFDAITPPYPIGDYAVNKLWGKNVFRNIKYPTDKIFEDVYTTYKVFDNANRVYIFKKNLYIYRRNNNSITRTNHNENKFNFYDAIKEKFDYLLAYNSKYIVEIKCVVDVIILLFNGIKRDDEIMLFQSKIIEFKNFIEKYKSDIYNNSMISADDLKVCEEICDII